MIRTSKTLRVSAHVKKRSAKMKAKVAAFFPEEGITEVRVSPDRPGKVVRIVSFRRVKGDVEITCHAEKSLLACEGNRYGRLCSHASRAIEELLRDGERETP